MSISKLKPTHPSLYCPNTTHTHTHTHTHTQTHSLSLSPSLPLSLPTPEAEESTEPDVAIIDMLELSNRGFRITVINTEKVQWKSWTTG